MKYLALVLFVSNFLFSRSNGKIDDSKNNLDLAQSKSIDSLSKIIDSLSNIIDLKTNRNSDRISDSDKVQGVLKDESECLGTNACPDGDIKVKLHNRYPGWDISGIDSFIGNGKWVFRVLHYSENDPRYGEQYQIIVTLDCDCNLKSIVENR